MSDFKFNIGDRVVHKGTHLAKDIIGVVVERITRECYAGTQRSYLVSWAHNGYSPSVSMQSAEYNEVILIAYPEEVKDAKR